MEYTKPESYFQETTASSELIFDGKVLHLYRDDINLPNGGLSMRVAIRLKVQARCITRILL